MVALVAIASMETSAPRSPLFSASRHLAGLVWHGLLAEHQAARGGEGRDKVERGAAVGAVVAAARGLSIDGRLVVTVTAAFSARMVDIGPPLVPMPSSFCTTQWCVV